MELFRLSLKAKAPRLGLTVINAAWLAPLGPSLCTFSKPIPLPVTMKDAKPGQVLVVPKFGPASWELPPLRKPAETSGKL